jgi:hypothetical protein
MPAVKMAPCDYAGGAPEGYRCNFCDAHGVKLWREYQTAMVGQELYCAACAVKKAGRGGEVDADGKWLDPTDKHGIKSDAISWRVPAVPTAEGDTFWGYTSVPAEGVAWWRRLPTSAAKEAT